MRTFHRAIRIFASVTLFFFCWTFMPLWQAVAYAAAPEARKNPSSEQGVRSLAPQPGERFEKALETIREKVTKAEEKDTKNQDITAEVAEVKKQRAEIESVDADLRKEFAATEKKLKDAKLPKEILDRHAKFVAHYESNLKELRTNLDGIDQAKTTKDRKAKIEKARLHLEKVKPPKKHKPLDPNNLPNRLVKGKERAPRLKKEEFEKDFPRKERGKGQVASSKGTVYSGDKWAVIRNLQSSIVPKPILVASNGPLTGILSSDNNHPRPLRERIEVRGDFIPDFAFTALSPNTELLTPNYEIAQAVNLPTADDLAETPEVQFTDAIRAKAQELGGNPVKIYNWVRNNIEYAPTYGSIQGADQCLQSKICNDMDTASLLIALLRVSGIYSHYVYGTVEIPIEKAMNWVGGATNPLMAGTVFATNGVPVTALISGSTIKYEQIEHVWVNAYIDYIPSRGAVQRQGNTWIPLDASYKQYAYTHGIDIASAVPFDAQNFANQILATATTNTTDGSVTNVNSTFIQQTMTSYQTQVQNYIQQNHPNATVGDVIGKKEIIQESYPILAGTLQYKVDKIGTEFSIVPDNLRETISFSIPDPTGATGGLSYTIGMPQIAGKKITLSFSLATANDQAVIQSLLPQPHADGSPIQPSELPSSLQAYLINLVPELRIDGQVVATGTFTTMGSEQAFTISLNEPGIGVSKINNVIKSGEFFGIGVDTGRMVASRLNTLRTSMESTKAKIDNHVYDGLNKDNLVGDLLYTTIASYFAALDASDEIIAQTMDVIRLRAPSVGMFSIALNVRETFGIPTSAGPKGMMLDVDRIMQAVFCKDGSIGKVKQYMLSSGSNSSSLEHAIPEKLFSTSNNQIQGISAVKALNAANDQGIPIYVINQSNINTISPQLQLSSDAKTDIQNAVNAGKIVTAPKTNVTVNGWTGCGYVIIDPNTGAGAYMINDGLNGGGFMYMFWTVMWVLAWIALITASTVFVVTLGAVIATSAGAIAVAVGELYAAISQLYLTASVATFLFMEGGVVRSAIFNALIFYGQNSPPPLPVPTSGIDWVVYYLVYRVFLYLGIRDFIRSGWLTIYWRLAMSTEILSGYNQKYLKRICIA